MVGAVDESACEVNRKAEDVALLVIMGFMLVVCALMLFGCAFSCTLAAQEPLPPLKPATVKPMEADPLWNYGVPR